MIKKMQYRFYTRQNIKPTGWLKEQLKLEANGLCGNLDKVWPDVRDSAWIGGKREGWERVPYWLDGFVPLAYLINDNDMIERAEKYINAIILAQNTDGWICPCAVEERGQYDAWAILLIAKVLTVYADCSGDNRIEEVLSKCLKNLDNHLNSHTLCNWGAARWFEGLIPIIWLYERRPDDWLINLAKKLNVQGFNWRNIFESGYIDTCTEGWDYYSHVVNVAMMLKSEALFSLFTNTDSSDFNAEVTAYLDAKHGTAGGHFNGDECLSGNSPVNGAELCSIVEAMYSYELLFAITGNCEWLDRLEKLAYNALPAAISRDMWSHQYVQMINQIGAFPMAKPPFRNNNYVAHTFGLEPHFGCCTSNFGQGWPKFALTAFMNSDNGIASCAIAPSRLETEIDGNAVICELITNYPFGNTLTYRICTRKPTRFTFSIRVPSCAAAAELDGVSVKTGEFVNITKTWDGSEDITLKLKFETKLLPRPNDMICIWRGPLLYSISIKEKWERVEYQKDGVERKFPYCDYYVYPESKWNYALAGTDFEIIENSAAKGYGSEVPPVEMIADMYEINWGVENGHCFAVPQSRIPIGKMEKVKLVPYGWAKLRMTEIPHIK